MKKVEKVKSIPEKWVAEVFAARSYIWLWWKDKKSKIESHVTTHVIDASTLAPAGFVNRVDHPQDSLPHSPTHLLELSEFKCNRLSEVKLDDLRTWSTSTTCNLSPNGSSRLSPQIQISGRTADCIDSFLPYIHLISSSTPLPTSNFRITRIGIGTCVEVEMVSCRLSSWSSASLGATFFFWKGIDIECMVYPRNSGESVSQNLWSLWGRRTCRPIPVLPRHIISSHVDILIPSAHQKGSIYLHLMLIRVKSSSLPRETDFVVSLSSASSCVAAPFPLPNGITISYVHMRVPR